MKRLVLLCTHTLYSKPLIALAYLLKDDFDEIIFRDNSKLFRTYNKNKILNEIYNNPTRFKILNDVTYEAVASQINYKKEWRKTLPKISFKKFFFFRRKDIIFCTTKDINKYYYLNYLGFKLFVIGYQHIPIVGIVKRIAISSRSISNNFFLNHYFSKKHNFNKILSKISFKTTNFPYLFKQINSIKDDKNIYKNNSALIFHPGGSRGVISNPNDSKETIYKIQETMFLKLLMPLINNNLDVYIKVHPLRAKYHDFEDIKFIILNSSLSKFSSRINIIPPDESYFSHAKNAKFIFTLGSSSIYEIWLMGLENAYVINFFGNSRSKNFNLEKNIMLNSLNDYESLIARDNNLYKNTNSLKKNIFDNLEIKSDKELKNYLLDRFKSSNIL